MLCMKQCVDMCELGERDVKAIAARMTMPEIIAYQANCPKLSSKTAANDDGEVCGILEMRERLLLEVRDAEDFSDLAQVLHHYRQYAVARERMTL